MGKASAPGEDRSPAIGWIGLDAPLELIEASGRRPQRLTAQVGLDDALASAYGEGGGHPWMRAMVARLAAAAPDLERVVLCSTPANELWLYNFLLSLTGRGEDADFPAADLLNLSHEPRASAERLNIQGLHGLAERLGASLETPALMAAIGSRNRVRAALRRIDAMRFAADGGISGVEARRLMDPADDMKSEDYLAWIEAQLARPLASGSGLPVIFSGPAVPALDLYGQLEAHGLRIVGDDADIGSRAIGPDVAENQKPFHALADRYRRRSPAPAGWPTAERVAWLLNMATTRRARAVLFDLPPWSHPAAWDYPTERRALEAQGIACIELTAGEPAAIADAASRAAYSLVTGAEASHV